MAGSSGFGSAVRVRVRSVRSRLAATFSRSWLALAGASA
jgi:hypothetical protein